jgi:hypothetical protein
MREKGMTIVVVEQVSSGHFLIGLDADSQLTGFTAANASLSQRTAPPK